MVEQGLVNYIDAGLAAAELPVPGGFAVQLLPQQITASAPQAWTYRSITDHPGYNLTEFTGWNEWTVQIDCHGASAAQAQALAQAIGKLFRTSFQGQLGDPDETRVFGWYQLPTQVDGFSDANRSYVRTLEFVIQYQQI